MTYIEEYYDFLKKNPDKACHKVLVTYKKLVDDIKKPKKVSFFNEITEEEEIHTYSMKKRVISQFSLLKNIVGIQKANGQDNLLS